MILKGEYNLKDQLIFDTTDANTIIDSDSVGAFLRSSDGTLIDKETVNAVERLAVDSTLKDGSGVALTSTLVGGKQSLDVNVVEGVNVEVDLDAADDSVAAWLNDGAGNAINSTGGAIHISDAGGSITVDAVDLDIRDLTAASDSVQSWAYDGAGTAITSTLEGGKQGLDVYLTNAAIDIEDVALANTAIANNALSVAAANTAESIVGSALADRKYFYAYNADNRKMFIGGAGVTSANGFPVSPGAYINMRAGAAIDVQVVSPKVGHDVRTLELS